MPCPAYRNARRKIKSPPSNARTPSRDYLVTLPTLQQKAVKFAGPAAPHNCSNLITQTNNPSWNIASASASCKRKKKGRSLRIRQRDAGSVDMTSGQVDNGQWTSRAGAIRSGHTISQDPKPNYHDDYTKSPRHLLPFHLSTHQSNPTLYL